MSSEWEGPEADLIAAEIGRCVLGGRGPVRIEQQMTARGSAARMGNSIKASLITAFQDFGAAVAKMEASMRKTGDEA